MAQVQRLRDLPGSPVAALKYLSSSVTYRGSRGDLAEARRTYVEHPSLVHDEARVIYGREKLYRSAKMGMWTYPGWRVDVSEALRSYSSSFDRALGELDRKQEIHEGVPPGVFSAGWTSCESYLSLIPRSIYFSSFYVFVVWIIFTLPES